MGGADGKGVESGVAAGMNGMLSLNRLAGLHSNYEGS